MSKSLYLSLLLATAAVPAVAADAPATGDASIAARFGARPAVHRVELSPDGQHIVYVTPGPGHGRVAVVLDVATGQAKPVLTGGGDPFNIESCGWASNTRLICRLQGVMFDDLVPTGLSRTISIDSDGKNSIYLGRQEQNAEVFQQYDGDVLDWLDGEGSVLMLRYYAPEQHLGSHMGNERNGWGVDRVDAATGRAVPVEFGHEASEFYTDGQGHVRIEGVYGREASGQLTGNTTYTYRKTVGGGWSAFSFVKADRSGLNPLAVDGTRNLAYASNTLNGRDALYSVALDGSMKTDLVLSDPAVDVNTVVGIGRRGRVIGAELNTDRLHMVYFDPEYKNLAAALGRALPKTPNIEFVSASADEKRLIIYAYSDVDPGRFYLFDKTTHHLDELLQSYPGLSGIAMAPMTSITYKAADGTVIPAYLTLPPGGARTGLPAIVMPHGGPDSRDSWGFDYLVQFFAQRGYAVIQPEYRGSMGYGDQFYAKNGFRSWQTAISDVCDAGRYLIAQGIAAPSKLAIVGWSYGGYAALQANVLDPSLFKAVIAVAPVTDLAAVKAESNFYTNHRIAERQIGSGDAIVQGSPARHADRFQAPVLMFHGDHDTNVAVAESRAMDAALRRAGKSSTLIVFPGLDHQIDDADARTKLLEQSDDFLRTNLKL